MTWLAIIIGLAFIWMWYDNLRLRTEIDRLELQLTEWEMGFASYRRAVDRGNEDFEVAMQRLHQLLDRKVIETKDQATWN